MPVTKPNNVIKPKTKSKPNPKSKPKTNPKTKSTPKPKSKPKSMSTRGGVSNKVAPYNPPTSRSTQSKPPSQSSLVSVVKNLLNKSNTKVAADKPRFGFSSKK